MMLDIDELRRVNFGVRVDDVGAEAAVRDSSGAAKREGLLVSSVRPGSAAAKAGLLVEDVITAVNSKAVGSVIDFHLDMLEMPLDTKMTFSVWRDEGARGGRHRESIDVVLRQRPKPDAVRLADEFFGLKVGEVTKELERRYKIVAPLGSVVVLGVRRGSPADSVGVAEGDVLLSVGNKPIENLDQLGRILELVAPDTLVQMTLAGIRSPAGWNFRQRVQYTCTMQAQGDATTRRIEL